MNTNLNTNIFNTKLYEMLCDDSSDNNEENECLITLEPLDDDYVEMSCKHKFNFAALFKFIKMIGITFSFKQSISIVLSNISENPSSLFITI